MDIAIIDDDVAFINYFSEILKKSLNVYFEAYTIHEINNKYIEKINENVFEVIFLDINLMGQSGIDLGATIKKKNKNAVIVFMSANSELVFDTFEVRPLCFIRKLYLINDLERAIKLLNNHFLSKPHSIIIELYGDKEIIELGSIIYLEVDKHFVYLVTQNKTYSYRITLKKLLATMNSKQFVQIQKSIVININYIEKITKEFDCHLTNGNVFTINRFYKKDVLKQYKEYILI